MSEEFFEEQKYYIDHRKIHANETSNQCEHIAKFFILFDIIFVLQCEFIEDVREYQITSQRHKFCE